MYINKLVPVCVCLSWGFGDCSYGYYRGFILITLKGFHVILQCMHKLFGELYLKSDTVAQIFRFFTGRIYYSSVSI